jgi:hypothetical protein
MRLRLLYDCPLGCNLLWKKSTITGEGKAYDRLRRGGAAMADRQQFFRPVEADPELTKILETSRETSVTEAELREQRISFAYGNAPQSSENRITKDSVRLASEHIKLLP